MPGCRHLPVEVFFSFSFLLPMGEFHLIKHAIGIMHIYLSLYIHLSWDLLLKDTVRKYSKWVTEYDLILFAYT